MASTLAEPCEALATPGRRLALGAEDSHPSGRGQDPVAAPHRMPAPCARARAASRQPQIGLALWVPARRCGSSVPGAARQWTWICWAIVSH
jgi:hypothetical protein